MKQVKPARSNKRGVWRFGDASGNILISNLVAYRPLSALLYLICLLGLASTVLGQPSVAMIEPVDGGSDYWTRWRGPSGQGWVDGENYPDHWSETENVVWRAAIPGSGNSSPIVWRDRIFLTTSRAGGKRRAILAFQRSDGKLLWETFAPEVSPEKSHRKNGHASSTPTTDGEHIYAFLGNHGLLALDLEGKQVWHIDLGEFEPSHGTASSPLLYKNLIIVAQDHRGGSGSFILAVDKLRGKLVWKTSRTAKVGWNSPIAIRVDKRDEIILSGQRQVQAYDPATGKELWIAKGNTYEAIPTPVIAEGLIFCSSGRAGPTLAIRPGGSGDVTDTHILWKSPKGSPFVPSPLVADGYLYMVNDMAGIATCLEAKSGKVMWQGRLGESRRESFSASPVMVDGKIFITNDNGETFVLQSGNKFELLHVNRLGERVLASPALVDGRWYFRTAEHLVAIGSDEPGDK